MHHLYKFVLSALLCLTACEAYKILVVFPMASKSHGILGEGVVRHLLNAGHEVTFITPFPKDNPDPKLRQIKVSDKIDHDVNYIKQILDNELEPFNPFKVVELFMEFSRRTMQNPQVQEMLNDPKQTFDVVVAEWMFSEIYAGFAAVYGCPLIWLSSVEPHTMILQLVDESLHPAYNPGLMSSSAPPFTFMERVKELFFLGASLLLKNVFLVSYEREAYEEMYVPVIKMKGRPVPTFDEIKYNVSLILGNSHVSLGQATRLPQNYKAVAGYHIDTNFKPLPEDLKNILDNAKHGVIYFSMGSNLKSKDMPEKLKMSLLKMFGGLKQTVLWKFEDTIEDLPKNVHILQWAPQPAILSHPNCILFITHGGLLSFAEAVHFGKPTIGIPVFADQFTNVERAVKKGFMKRVDLSYTMAEELEVAIKEVTTNPSYTTRAKELSLIFHDRPTHPGSELAHWVSHVIKTGGAPHLQSPALHTPFYQKMYLDLVALVLVVIVALRLIVKRICCRRSRLSSEKKNQ
ncbi:UDP-glucosyltransferase 2-like [Ostrinia nubilalis]|uniref:UDP-glucosyltransferase 2-like n=1 Tax=Ostrinia nubilalis TaxID=29057 RepID=UPI00308225E5